MVSSSSLHISSKESVPLKQHLAALGRRGLRHISAELFFEVENLWVDDIVLEDDSPSYTILKAISVCPTLCTLQLYSTKATSAEVLPLLAATIQTSPLLTDISATRVIRFSDDADVHCLANAVRDHPSLQSFKMIHPHLGGHPKQQRSRQRAKRLKSNVSSSTATANTLPLFDALIVALGSANHLSSVDITLYTSEGDEEEPSVASLKPFISVQSLQSLLSGARELTTLSLWGCGLGNAHLDVFRDTAHQLQFLSLRRNPRITNWAPFYQSLVHNYELKALYNDHADVMSADHPALTCHSAGALSSSFSRSGECTPAAAALEAEVCLSLNRWDRKYMLQQANREEFVDMLADMSDSLDALHYLLSAKPSFITETVSRKATSPSSATTTKRAPLSSNATIQPPVIM